MKNARDAAGNININSIQSLYETDVEVVAGCDVCGAGDSFDGGTTLNAFMLR